MALETPIDEQSPQEEVLGSRNAGKVRRRIAGGFLVLGLGPLLLVAYLATSLPQTALRDQIFDRVSGGARQSALYIDQAVTRWGYDLQAYGHRGSMITGAAGTTDPAALAAVNDDFTALQHATPPMTDAELLDLHGHVLDGLHPAATPSDAETAAVKPVASGSVSLWISPVDTGRSILTLAAPVQAATSNSPAGVLVAEYSLTGLDSTVTEFAKAQGFSVAVYDHSGNVVTSLAADSAFSPPTAGAGPVRDALNGKDGTAQESSSNGDVFNAYAQAPTLTWAVMVSAPSSTAFAPISNLNYAILAITAALAVLFLVGIRVLNVALRRLQVAEEQVRQSAVQLRERALHDPLTGLANRDLFHDRLGYALSYAERLHRQVALLGIDLDRFKSVNDSFGHHVGDALLVEVTRRLREVVRQSDTAARLGGDEFAVIAPDTDLDGAVSLAAKINESLSQPFIVEGHDVTPEASIGIAVYPEHAQDHETLLKRSDSAMYEVKRRRAQARMRPGAATG